ncbi:MAG: hypothetical protein Q9160_005321 [Pyrenula sp. 1 TL-2023]
MSATPMPVEFRDVFPDAHGAHGYGGALDEEIRSYLRDNLWPSSTQELADYDNFLTYFQKCISDVVSIGFFSSDLFAMATMEQFVIVKARLEANRDRSKLETARALATDFPEKDERQRLRSLELVARIWLTLDIQVMYVARGSNSFVWNTDDSLTTMVKARFTKLKVPTEQLQSAESILLDQTFSAIRMKNICGVKIAWTNNLTDHLSYDLAKDCVYIYPHKVCLLSHLQCCQVFEAEVLKETVRTLDLLFPIDPSTNHFLNQQKQTSLYSFGPHDSDASPPTDLTEFNYWRRKLTILYGVFKRQSTSAYQMWHDRRNPLQWYTFWLAAIIAVLTVVFGIISSYALFKQTSLAQKAYDLSVLQTCNKDHTIYALCPS